MEVPPGMRGGVCLEVPSSEGWGEGACMCIPENPLTLHPMLPENSFKTVPGAPVETPLKLYTGRTVKLL